ncbi:MAG: helix-turn-helix transcriptional regulator [Chloroflexi bacterium]|nr:helix-turn-helix transcriptional regulator [Chloroflexota bacterium]
MKNKYGRGSGNPHPADIHAGQQLRKRREECGLSQEQVAAKLHRSFQQIQKYENGTNRIAVSTLCQLAQFLEVDFNYFVEGFKLNASSKKKHLDPPPVSWINAYQSLVPWQRQAAMAFIRTLKTLPKDQPD